MQIKFEGGLESYENGPKGDFNTLTDKQTIVLMAVMDRFPIPEALMNRPPHYWLKIDSFMHDIYDFKNQ
jgi:hypothetical protein